MEESDEKPEKPGDSETVDKEAENNDGIGIGGIQIIDKSGFAILYNRRASAEEEAECDELYGNNTIGPDGKTADNGYVALTKHDLNQDGAIDSLDDIYAKLRLWDEVKSCDGKADESELRSLQDAGGRLVRLVGKNYLFNQKKLYL